MQGAGVVIRRRLYAEIRTSRLAVWSSRLAIFALPVLLLAILLHRAGAIEYHAALALLIAVLLIALAALMLAMAALIVIWNDGLKGLGSAMLAGVLAAAILAYPAFEILRGAALPAINDISTDTADPPRFHSIAVLRPRSANPVRYAGGEAIDLQKKFYPAVRSLEFDAEADEIFGVILALVQRSGWQLVDNIGPAPNRDGVIEAVARTAIMGFREDISIRVRKAGNIVRVDLRSASRYGQRDFGTNARRIESFLALLADARRRPR